jgi:uncharacterized peroxidase-related enzyme
MTWIKTVPWGEASPELRAILETQRAFYPPEYSKPVHPTADGGGAQIVAAHTLIPEALHHAFATFGALMAPDLPLSRAQHEMIATHVSVLNGCRFCAVSHAEFLRRVTGDEALSRALTAYYEEAPLSAADRAMLDFAGKMTTDPSHITREDHARLQAAGFDDRAILQITLIAAWFNYINRVAHALGLGQEA